MSAVMKEAPRSAQLSYDLGMYVLNKKQQALLTKFDELANYMKLTGKTPPLFAAVGNRLRADRSRCSPAKLRSASARRTHVSRAPHPLGRSLT